MHTCACIISFTVHTDQHPVWGQPFQPGDGCILFNSHDNCLFEQLRAGKFFSQLFEEEIPVGIPSGDDIVVDVVGGNLFVRKSIFLNTLITRARVWKKCWMYLLYLLYLRSCSNRLEEAGGKLFPACGLLNGYFFVAL